MPVVKKMLLSYDLDLLGRIGSFWGVDTKDLDLEKSVESIVNATQDQTLFSEILESLPSEAKNAWLYLTANNGKVTWAQFIRKYGEVREFGRAKREREAPDRNPSSIAEILWYRGLVGRAFLNIPPEPREFVFIPDEFLLTDGNQLQPVMNLPEPLREEMVEKTPQTGSALPDHLTDWLAARRKGTNLPGTVWQIWPENDAFLQAIAREAKLVDQKDEPDPKALADFFREGRENLLRDWLALWLDTKAYNDLRSLPGLIFEGSWQNDPQKPRKMLLEIFKGLTSEKWYSLAELVAYFKSTQPDFQRPSGDYDSWFIRKEGTNEYLSGYDRWDEVDGALIRYLICGPFQWLGMTRISSIRETSETCFRMTPLLQLYFDQEREYHRSVETSRVHVSTDLVFSFPVGSLRALRYQTARFCEFHSATADETKYEINPASMRLAQKHGLKPTQLVMLLEKHMGKSLPKALLLLAEKWEENDVCNQIEKQFLLRSPKPEILAALKDNPQTGKFIRELITPTIAIISPAGIKMIKKSLLEQGLLTEVILDQD